MSHLLGQLVDRQFLGDSVFLLSLAHFGSICLPLKNFRTHSASLDTDLTKIARTQFGNLMLADEAWDCRIVSLSGTLFWSWVARPMRHAEVLFFKGTDLFLSHCCLSLGAFNRGKWSWCCHQRVERAILLRWNGMSIVCPLSWSMWSLIVSLLPPFLLNAIMYRAFFIVGVHGSLLRWFRWLDPQCSIHWRSGWSLHCSVLLN